MAQVSEVRASFTYSANDVRALLRAHGLWLRQHDRKAKPPPHHRVGFAILSKKGVFIRVSLLIGFLACIAVLGAGLVESNPGLMATDLMIFG